MSKRVDVAVVSHANLFSFLVLGYAHMVAPQPEYTASGCYEIGGPGGSARCSSSRRLVALSINVRQANAIVPEKCLIFDMQMRWSRKRPCH